MLRTGPGTELRRCSTCGAPTLACVRDWQHRLLGAPTPSRTQEFACQRCGFRVTLQPRAQIDAARLFAWLLLPAVLPGVIFFARARRMERAWTDHPLVGFTPSPPSLGPVRACLCGGAAACVGLQQRRVQGLPIGTRATYACPRCGCTFEVSDGRGVLSMAVAAFALSAFGLLLVVSPPGSDVGAEHHNRLFGVAVLVLGALTWAMLVSRIRVRAHHPLVA